MGTGPLRVGVIGCGRRITNVLDGLRELDGDVRVAAVADPQGAALRDKHPVLLRDADFVPDAAALLAGGSLDGVLIGTRCPLHAEMAARVAGARVPLFLEKPVGISFDQLRALHTAWTGAPADVVVSFPLRVSPIVKRVKEIVDAGTLGTVEHLVAFNDVPYGEGYFAGWYRNYDQVGGLFLQKATHDLDYIAYLLGSRPAVVAAMKSRRVWTGDEPFDLMCKDCRKQADCPESPFNPASMIPLEHRWKWEDNRMCLYAKDIRNEDSGQCLVEYASGVQATYVQNFFARRNAGRRGARLYGYKATLEFDWYTSRITIHHHDRPVTETIALTGDEAHFGGDRVLCRNFLDVMRGSARSDTPLAAGIESALTCLHARASAETRTFRDVVLPSP